MSHGDAIHISGLDYVISRIAWLYHLCSRVIQHKKLTASGNIEYV